MFSKGKKNHGISIQVADKADPVSGPNFDRLDRKRTRSKPLKPVGFVSSRYKKSAKESLEAATKTPKDDDLENYTNIAEFGEWERHTRGIGAKLVQKMGYETGKGLGKNLQGRSTIVEAQFRTGRQGFGTCGKKNRPSKNFVKSETDEKVVENFVEKFQNLKMEDHKATGRKKINCVYKSVNQTYKSAHNSKVKIIDLTEKEQRILTSFHEFFILKIKMMV